MTARIPPPGLVLYDGPSTLTGERVLALLTGTDPSRPSENPKTGPVLQCWILAGDIDPPTAARDGRDRAVCGDCPARRASGGWCYVTTAHAPLGVYRAWKAGHYPPWRWAIHAPLTRGRVVRLGAYGDPVAVPAAVWDRLALVSGPLLGYTHQWRTCDQALRRRLMASCDSPADYHAARAAGWRPFRTRSPDEPLLPGEFVCPADAHAGQRMTCERCRACGGATDSPHAASPAVAVHGRHKSTAYRTHRQSLTLIGE